jgi:hypothetical protein
MRQPTIWPKAILTVNLCEYVLEPFMKSWLPKVSLREFLAIVAFVAIACGALKYASEVWLIVLLTALGLLACALVIVAFIERSSRQAAAIGALAALAIYGVIWAYEPTVETSRAPTREIAYDRYTPSTLLLNRTWLWIRASYVVEGETDRVVGKLPEYQPYANGQLAKSFDAEPLNWKGGLLIIKNRPKPEVFIPIGHMLFAFALAYLGGKFAVWVYERRARRESHE